MRNSENAINFAEKNKRMPGVESEGRGGYINGGDKVLNWEITFGYKGVGNI